MFQRSGMELRSEQEKSRMTVLSQQERNIKAIAEFRMFDDTFMSAVFDGQIE